MQLRYLVFTFFIVLASALRGAPALASESREILPAGQLGLAADLRWGMSTADAKIAAPGLLLAPDPGRYDPRLALQGTGTIYYSGCPLGLTLSFFRDKLDRVRVRSRDGTLCHARIERELTQYYGDPNIPASCPNIISRQWLRPGMQTEYDYTCIETQQRGMDVKFTALENFTGRQTANFKCNVLDVEILPPSDGSPEPSLVPGYSDLGCQDDYYPPVSIRLRETGIPVVNVRIGINGIATGADLASSSGKPRLDDAALRITRDVLRFQAAKVDGQPVEVTRQIRFLFKARPIGRGIVDPIAVTELYDTWGFHWPNVGHSTAERVGADHRPSLNLVSNDIKQGMFRAPDGSSPALSWSLGPLGTQSYMLVAEEAKISAHEEPQLFWAVLNIPRSVRALPRNVSSDLKLATPEGAVNAFLATWRDKSKRPGLQHLPNSRGAAINVPIRFQLFALDKRFALDKWIDIDPLRVDRGQLIDAMKGHVLAAGEITTLFWKEEPLTGLTQ
jgi:TonB family protein